MASVHAIILISENVFTLTNDETSERPVALADTEFLATGIIQFIKPTNDYVLQRRPAHNTDSERLLRTTIIARMMDGMPVAAA